MLFPCDKSDTYLSHSSFTVLLYTVSAASPVIVCPEMPFVGIIDFMPHYIALGFLRFCVIVSVAYE